MSTESTAKTELPIGRRVAQWRVRRRMTQQVLADRLGKSKSWMDKVERGVRTLDKYSTVQQIAQVLRVDPTELLGGEGGPPTPTAAGAAAEIDGLRAALASYDVFRLDTPARPPPTLDELWQRVAHAWSTYRHAHYPQLLRMLPGLLDTAQRRHATEPATAAEPLTQTYRITASALVKLGEADLAWLAADRAVTVASSAAAGDPLLAASAAVPLGQILRALQRHRLAMATSVAAAHRIAPQAGDHSRPQRQSVYGTLLLQAALAAAAIGDTAGTGELIRQAAQVADRVGDGHDHDHEQTAFGPVVVELARVVTAVDLGQPDQAVRRHDTIVTGPHWSQLPAEHRAAYLIDAARAYLHVGDIVAAGRTLVDADRVAPAEVRLRPAARTVVTEVARHGPESAGVARLATAIGLTW
ncbi:helix-turn-helix domain-containing protein [Solwaraspora sp. WMMD406]|uniref:helix-turn-helix domain-containing protein n=1 Tax=Solwaraspora sp. WMMD406 TaxID=3016095 RepID=UPI00241781E3|nr:helix-turn-helix domain-containing protein [Solwaraspora sp. WMMD406]MDG4766774.1 helix-turn-helix domain-containing protein [Solwaraspora sp. WMMD406]